MALLIHRAALSNKTLHLRFFSQAAIALDTSSPASPSSPSPLTYLEGFPTPDPKYAETILAVPRATSGKNIAAKERKVGRVPSIVFEQEDGQHGGNKRLISVQTNQIRKLVKHLGESFFLSRLFDLEVRSEFGTGDLIEKVRVLPRKLHLHAGTESPLNVTFIRAPSNALLKVDIPLVFRGEDVCPGLRKGLYLNTIKRTVKFLCPADVIPPYIDVDLSELDGGQKLVMGDLKVHPALKLIQSKDEPTLSEVITTWFVRIDFGNNNHSTEAELNVKGRTGLDSTCSLVSVSGRHVMICDCLPCCLPCPCHNDHPTATPANHVLIGDQPRTCWAHAGCAAAANKSIGP
ncbi:hypothetical protein V6N12_046734 [Hibiscus sabdariffa]|uniref:Ribosomal protein L25 beta domain-containing protein n=1 Tax=Hibiscus sabdariffa TaxID=183260 RepID=A0ABR2AST2_9ROSI